MEAIYYVLCWQCHRRCPHCYDDRFRPYHGEDLRTVIDESQRSLPRIIANLPLRMTFLDTADPEVNGSFVEKRGRIILAGGEVLHDSVREPVLYPTLEMLHARYRDQGAVDLVVQTTGDLVTGRLIDELLERRVNKISVSGLDSYHVGMETGEARTKLRTRLTELFEAHGMVHDPGGGAQRIDAPARTPGFSFFGATPDSWIGALWPRGRAHQNELSTATLNDNFCNRWSGGLNFLAYRLSGSEVSIDPEGNVYPCCIKTRKALGSLLEEPLEQILDRLAGDPVYEAISMGHPERMGITHGWTVEQFLAKSQITLPSGKVYRNLCIGCDSFHDEVLLRRNVPLVQIGEATHGRKDI